MPQPLAPFRPRAARPWDYEAAAHLWRRAAFGASDETIVATLQRSPEAAARAIVRGPENDTATAELETLWRPLLAQENPNTFRAWLFSRMARSGHQLREKMALFWHGHFATSLRKVRKPVWMMRQYRLFLDRGLGTFGKLLDGAARDPAMIRWLDNESNRKGHANENFARELFELFTLGAGNYTERDIQEAARAFTGWTIVGSRFRFSRPQHDAGTKMVFGKTGRFGGNDILRMALEHEACARFLATKLLQFFAEPEPPTPVVEAVAHKLRSTGYDVAGTLETLFASAYFHDPRIHRALVKSPLEFVVGAMRALRTKADAPAMLPLLKEMGQELLAPPNVKGWPGHRTWIHTSSWLARLAVARAVVSRWEPPAGGRDAARAQVRALLGRSPDEEVRRVLERGGARKADAVLALLSLPRTHLN